MIRQALQVLASQQKVDSLKKKNPELADDIQTLADSDPSGNKKHTYLQWAVNKLKAGDGVNELVEAIESFHKAKKLLEEKDLNKYKTLEEVLTRSGEALRAEADAKKPELVYNKNGLRVHRIYTKAQMCEIGEDSDWCVADPKGTLWEKEYTNKSEWAFYVLETSGEKYLAYFVGEGLRELRDWHNNNAPEARTYLVQSGLLKTTPREEWPQWLQDADTEDADVSFEGEEVIWHGGTWKSGVWKSGVWEDGTWEDGVWTDGFWKSGTWKSGTWKSGYWTAGIWKSGVWTDGTWGGGTWHGGVWKRGTWHGGVWKRGTWHDGFWINGTWEYGTWEYGLWRDGAWKSGLWRDGTWKSGVWKSGVWTDGFWKSGVWEDGEWVKGLQRDSETRNFEETTEPPNSHQVKSSLAARVLDAVGAK